MASKTYPFSSTRQNERAKRYVNHYHRLTQADYDDPKARERLVTHGLKPKADRSLDELKNPEFVAAVLTAPTFAAAAESPAV